MQQDYRATNFSFPSFLYSIYLFHRFLHNVKYNDIHTYLVAEFSTYINKFLIILRECKVDGHFRSLKAKHGNKVDIRSCKRISNKGTQLCICYAVFHEYVCIRNKIGNNR